MTNIETGLITIGEFASAYEAGTIRPYDNNRGDGAFNRKLVKKYAKTWNTEASGCAILEKNGSTYTLRDFHNRAEAIKLGLKAGTIKPTEEILVRVVTPKHGLTSYRLVNAAKGHTSKEKLMNTDMAYGSQIARVLDKTQAAALGEVSPRQYYALAAIINDVRVKARSEYVLRNTHPFRGRIDATLEEAPELELKPSQVKAIAEAIDFWWACVTQMREQVPMLRNGNLPKWVDKLERSAHFLGFFCFDHMFKRQLPDPTVVGRRLAKGGAKLAETISLLQTGSNGDCLERQKRIYEQLRG